MEKQIIIERAFQNGGFTYFNIVAQSPDGELVKERLNSDAYLGIVAATNFKQRVRKMMEYTMRTGSTMPSRAHQTGSNTIRVSSSNSGTERPI